MLHTVGTMVCTFSQLSRTCRSHNASNLPEVVTCYASCYALTKLTVLRNNGRCKGAKHAVLCSDWGNKINELKKCFNAANTH